MALPVQNTPTYTLEIPSTKEKFKYRPFLVKEEKSLMIAQQSEDTAVMMDTLKSIIQSCARSNIDVDKLATFDLEYIFCQVRSKSVGELVDLIFFCDDCDDEKANVRVSFDVSAINITETEGHTKKIPLFDDVGIMMKYPNLDTITELMVVDGEDINEISKVVAKCIDYIYNTEEIFYAKDQTVEELTQFLDNLTQEQFNKIQHFFDTMPRLEQPVRFKCPVCTKEHNKVLRGLTNFF